MSSNRLGELLVRNEIINEDQLKRASEEQKRNGGRLGSRSCQTQFSRRKKPLPTFFPNSTGCRLLTSVAWSLKLRLSVTFLQKLHRNTRSFPLTVKGSTLKIAMCDPSNIFAIDDIKFMTGFNIEVLVASESAIKTAIDRYLRSKRYVCRCHGRP